MLISSEDLVNIFDELTQLRLAFLIEAGFISEPINVGNNKPEFLFDNRHISELDSLSLFSRVAKDQEEQNFEQEVHTYYTKNVRHILLEKNELSSDQLSKKQKKSKRPIKDLKSFLEEHHGYSIKWYIRGWRYLSRWLRPTLDANQQLDYIISEAISVAQTPRRMVRLLGPSIRNKNSGEQINQSLRIFIDNIEKLGVSNFNNELYIAKKIIEIQHKDDLVSATKAINVVYNIVDDYKKLENEVWDYLECYDPENLIFRRIYVDMFYPRIKKIIEHKKNSNRVVAHADSIIKDMATKSLQKIIGF